MSDFVWPPRNLPGQAEVWGRSVEGQVNVLDGKIVQTSQELNNGMRAMGGQLSVLASQIDTLTSVVDSLSGIVARIPITQSASESASGFALSGAYANKVSTSITVPEGMTRVSLTAIGYLHALDTLTGGVTTSRMRIGIDGNYSPDFWAAKDSGATRVLNVLNGNHAREYTVSSGASIDVNLQAYGLNASAFPADSTNFASLTILATFSRP